MISRSMCEYSEICGGAGAKTYCTINATTIQLYRCFSAAFTVRHQLIFIFIFLLRTVHVAHEPQTRSVASSTSSFCSSAQSCAIICAFVKGDWYSLRLLTIGIVYAYSGRFPVVMYSLHRFKGSCAWGLSIQSPSASSFSLPPRVFSSSVSLKLE